MRDTLKRTVKPVSPTLETNLKQPIGFFQGSPADIARARLQRKGFVIVDRA